MQKQISDIFTWIRHPVPRTLALSLVAGVTLGAVSLYATAELGRTLILLLGFPCLLALTNTVVMRKYRRSRLSGFASMALAQAVVTATLQFSGIGHQLHAPGLPDTSSTTSVSDLSQ